MEVHFVINEKIVNKKPFEINSLPIFGSEFIWVDFSNSLFEKSYQREISEYIWKVTNIRYICKSDSSLESIVFIVLEKQEKIELASNYGI